MFIRLAIPDGRVPLINMDKVEMAHDFGTANFGNHIGPAVQLWLDADRHLIVNATLEQLEGYLS